jgi:acyl-CoA hydrolase
MLQLDIVDPARAVADIRSGERVLIGSGAGTPGALVAALTARHAELRDVSILHILTLGAAPYVEPQYAGSFRHTAFFIGPNVRQAVQEGRADLVPVHLSEIPRVLEERLRPDWLLVQVSPPDRHGYCSIGVSADIVVAGLDHARHIVAQINPNMPRTWGDTVVHVSRFHCAIESAAELPELVPEPPDEVSQAIGRNVAELVRDGDCLQLGIGAIPNAVLRTLRDHRHLGVHTEMLSDGIVDLVLRGAVDCSRKNYHPHKIVCSFVMGTRRLYDFVDDNPIVECYSSAFVNDPFNISKNDDMVAVNGAIQLDLRGQVNADSLGDKPYSGFGGQVDFIRGAARSRRGRPIIALPSTAKGGTLSRIVPMLPAGAGVVTTAADVHFVATEYGVADLWAKGRHARARALIDIAHPAFREELERAARNNHLLPPHG